MNNQPAISIKNVSKSYKLYKASKDRLKEALHPLGKRYHTDFYAIRELNLEIKKGEILGIVGRNGCGKSTLLKLISKVLMPSAGEIKVNGKVTALLELGAGFNPEFTGRENIRFYSTILGLSNVESESLTPAIIEFAELGEFIDQPLKTYSSGMKSRLGFSVAIHIDPDILILDEVLAVGDALFKRKCYAKMEEFFKAGKTVLFVSHDSNSINRLCSRAVLLHNGEILMDGMPSQVTKYYEKLIFSKATNAKAVLDEIKALPEDSTSKDELIHHASIDKKVKPKPTQQQTTKLEPYYIPELIPKSTVSYGTEHAEIIDPHFTTTSGERVNVLVSGQDYVYVYAVNFKNSAKNISLGMQIKDEKGGVITGSSLHFNELLLINEVNADQQLIARWTFTCSLISGMYYLNAGVSQIIEAEPVFLARLVDAAVIKVIFDNKSLTRGIVNLGQTLEWDFV